MCVCVCVCVRERERERERGGEEEREREEEGREKVIELFSYAQDTSVASQQWLLQTMSCTLVREVDFC